MPHMASIKLWASSMMTTWFFSDMPSASRADFCRISGYGKVTICVSQSCRRIFGASDLCKFHGRTRGIVWAYFQLLAKDPEVFNVSDLGDRQISKLIDKMLVVLGREIWTLLALRH